MIETLRRLESAKLVAILRGVPLDKAEAVATALARGGITAIEVTFNTPNAPDIIRLLDLRLGDGVLLGAGTVLTAGEVRAAKQAGARFILSPNVKPEVIADTKALGLVSVPGAMTPTEVMTAHEAGADIIKIFPAGSLGPGYVRNLLGPMAWGKFMAVGGVDIGNAAEFFRAGAMSVGIGGSLTKPALIRDGDWKALAVLAARFVESVAGAERA